MFDNNYNAELTIKKWAKIFMLCGYIIMGISAFAALIIIFVNAKGLWPFSLATLIGGLLSGFGLIFASHIVWGFGDIVGNLSKEDSKKTSNTKENNFLPEL